MPHHAPNRTLIILILGSLATISPLAIDMYLPAFPGIAEALHTSTAKVSLSISSYFAGLAAGQLLYGPLLDRFGRKAPLNVGLVLFIGASLLCLRSQSIEWLVTMRFIQALGGCSAAVASMAMVRDFFEAHETARIISLMILILGVSPLLAPTIGGFLSVHFGWRSVFLALAGIAVFNIVLCYFYLPEGHQPDPSVSLRLGPMTRNFVEVLKEPQFVTYSVAGAFAFSGLLVYVAGAPILFLEIFHVNERTFGLIFAGLATGFIGSNQVNVWLLKKFTSEQIFLGTLLVAGPTSLFFLGATLFGGLGLPATLVVLFVALSSIGLACPNASALAICPFDHNIGSAAAMLGFVQIGVSGLSSAAIGVFDSHSILPLALIMAATTCLALGILLVGKRWIPEARYVEEKGVTPLAH